MLCIDYKYIKKYTILTKKKACRFYSFYSTFEQCRSMLAKSVPQSDSSMNLVVSEIKLPPGKKRTHYLVEFSTIHQLSSVIW